MKIKSDWPKTSLSWIENGTRYISVVFTWDLPKIERQLGWQKIIIGGPAMKLMPDYFKNRSNVTVGNLLPGALQMHNPNATRTSIGCIRKCQFCAVPKTEGKLIELDDWPDKPILIDNNLLACSKKHFDKVMDRLIKFDHVDFNQGLDARLLTDYHVERLAELKSVTIRLALDSMKYVGQWDLSLEMLLYAGIPKKSIRSYVLVAFDSGITDVWERCKYIEDRGVLPLPMWFTPLNALERNIVTEKQKKLGWTDYERRRIMQWFYHHKIAK